MSIWFIFGTFKACAAPRGFSARANEFIRVVVADALHNFHLLLAIMLPIVDIVDGALILQTLQKCLVLALDPLRLQVPRIRVQRFGNGSALLPATTQVADRCLLLATARLVGRDGWHVAFLMLGEVLSLARQNARHTLQ